MVNHGVSTSGDVWVRRPCVLIRSGNTHKINDPLPLHTGDLLLAELPNPLQMPKRKQKQNQRSQQSRPAQPQGRRRRNRANAGGLTFVDSSGRRGRGDFYEIDRYVPYTAYSSTGTAANSGVGSVAGDLYIASVGYGTGASPADTDGYNYSSFRFNFQAGDIFNIAEYTALFEEYRLLSVRLTITYVGNGTNPNTLARATSATSAQFMPTNPSVYLAYRIMHRDVAIPATSSAGWNNFHDASGVRDYRYPNFRVIRLNIRPYVMRAQQTSAASNTTVNNTTTARSPWLTTGNSTYTGATTVPHWGIDIMLRAENFVTNDTTNVEIIPHIFNVTAQYHVQFRYRKAGSTVLSRLPARHLVQPVDDDVDEQSTSSFVPA